MSTESDGFPDEPTFNLAALAGQEQLQERIRQLENERAGKVLVDPEDLRLVVNAAPTYDGQATFPALKEAWTRLAVAAGLVTGEAGSGSGAANSTGRVSLDPESGTEALSAAKEQS